jgi:glucose/mannose-6-phosphate isomerase
VTREQEALASLDDRALVERIDTQGLLRHIEGLPEQCADAWEQAAAIELPQSYREAREIVVLGMGGSAIAGDVVGSLAAISGRKPVSVVRGYDLPPYLGESTLAVACSHSGNTEETLSAFEKALDAGARLAVVTTGGRLRELAKEHSLPAFVYQFEGGPRSAIGHQLMRLLAVARQARALDDDDTALTEAVALMREQRDQLGFASPTAHNPAKQLAARLHGRLPVVIGAGVLAEAAHRWRTQFNENSKCWALNDELPELGHNSIVGFGLPREALDLLHAVFLAHPALHPRVLIQYDVIADELTRAGISHERVEAKGSSPLAQALSAIYFGDLVSYYLALLYGVDPSPVDPIGRLKARLAES